MAVTASSTAESGEKNHGMQASARLVSRKTSRPEAPAFQVCDDEKIAARADLLDGGVPSVLIYCVAGTLQRFAEHGAQFIFVFDQKERFHVLRFYHVLSSERKNDAGMCGESAGLAAVGGC